MKKLSWNGNLVLEQRGYIVEWNKFPLYGSNMMNSSVVNIDTIVRSGLNDPIWSFIFNWVETTTTRNSFPRMKLVKIGKGYWKVATSKRHAPIYATKIRKFCVAKVDPTSRFLTCIIVSHSIFVHHMSNQFPIGSMGLVYLPGWLIFFYGKCRYLNIPFVPWILWVWMNLVGWIQGRSQKKRNAQGFWSLGSTRKRWTKHGSSSPGRVFHAFHVFFSGF